MNAYLMNTEVKKDVKKEEKQCNYANLARAT